MGFSNDGPPQPKTDAERLDEFQLKDDSPMPFGKHKGEKMEDVPARYLFWLWTNGAENENSQVPDYIRRNLEALKKEYPNGIWD